MAIPRAQCWTVVHMSSQNPNHWTITMRNLMQKPRAEYMNPEAWNQTAVLIKIRKHLVKFKWEVKKKLQKESTMVSFQNQVLTENALSIIKNLKQHVREPIITVSDLKPWKWKLVQMFRYNGWQPDTVFMKTWTDLFRSSNPFQLGFRRKVLFERNLIKNENGIQTWRMCTNQKVH